MKDQGEGRQTTAGAPMPLRSPTPSLGHQKFYDRAGRNHLSRFPAGALRHRKISAPSCENGRQIFSYDAPCSLFIVRVMSSLTGRRPEGHGHIKRRLVIEMLKFFVRKTGDCLVMQSPRFFLSFIWTCGRLEDVASRPDAGGESCFAGFFLNLHKDRL